MDELESLLAVVCTEMDLIEGLEQISKLEVRLLDDLNSWTENALKTETEFSQQDI